MSRNLCPGKENLGEKNISLRDKDPCCVAFSQDTRSICDDFMQGSETERAGTIRKEKISELFFSPETRQGEGFHIYELC